MAVLKNIDKKAEEKGSVLVTLWQIVKFIVVSLGAMIVQVALQNILEAIPAIQELWAKDFQWFVFESLVNKDAAGVITSGGLGFFISYNTGNIIAQIVAFFINKEKTFNSAANIKIALPIYIVFTVLLLTFSAWLSPTLNSLFASWGWSAALASNAAMMVCSTIQFVAYFIFDKILFRKKKEEKTEEAK